MVSNLLYFPHSSGAVGRGNLVQGRICLLIRVVIKSFKERLIPKEDVGVVIRDAVEGTIMHQAGCV